MTETPQTDAKLARILAIRKQKGLGEIINPNFWIWLEIKRNAERKEIELNRNPNRQGLHDWLSHGEESQEQDLQSRETY